ncbi:hypothetical protein BJX70DRAFT_13138 [Aspergillus crustosus]
MAPNIPSAKLTLSCPLFAADFDPRNHAFLLVAGGGGEGRSGVGNKIVLINAYKRRELSEVVDIELSRDEDSVTSLAAAHSDDASIVAFVGINSSLAHQKQNKNRHLRSFQIEYPPRRTTSAFQEPSSTEKKPGQTINLSQESLFRAVVGPKGTTDTYQRITRLSPWRGDGATRVAAITTGLASSGEIVFFNANTTKPGERDVIARIRLKSDEEAEDIDIAGEVDEKGFFTVAYTNGSDVFTCRISPETRSNAAPDVRNVYSTPVNSQAKGPRPKFRGLRFLSPTMLLLLQNAPNRNGSQLMLLDLRPVISSSSSQATMIRQYKLRRSIKIGLGLDVCNLGANSEGQQQSMIAVSGSDQSLEVLTVDGTGSKYSSFRVYTALHDVHPFSMTRICFSPFTPPPHPVTSETPPQYVKLASVSMGNTVVVHTFALSPTPPSSRSPRYVLVRPGESDFLTGISSTLASLFSIALVLFILQAFTEIRGVMPPYLGITQYLPPDIRATIAVPYNAPPPLPSPLSPIKEAQLSTLSTPAQPEHPQSQSLLLRDIVPDSETSILISCNPSNNELIIESHTPNPASQLAEEGSETDPSKLHSDSSSTSHLARQWTDLSDEDRMSWKTQLINAALWNPQEDENESILQSVFFKELCPSPQISGGDGDGGIEKSYR